MDIPLDEVIYFDAISSSSTGAAADADSTPTFAVYEEATDTDIGVGGNMTKRTSLTGNYRGSFTASAANGFEVGKWYNVIGSATIGAVACKGVLMRFRIVPAEANAGYPRTDPAYWGGTAVASANVLIDGAITNAKFAADTGLKAIRTGTAQAGTSSTITLDSGASSTNDFYYHSFIRIVSGTGSDQNWRVINAYTGSTKVASVVPSWNTTPDNTSVFVIAYSAESHVRQMEAGSVTATAIATGAIDSDAIDSTAVTEIQSGLATQASVDTIDTVVDAIKAKTDNLPVDPADASDILGYYNALSSSLTTIAGYLDTEVAAILAKTNNLPSDPADQSAVEAAIAATESALTTLINTVDTVVDAIKVKTDQLGFTNANKVDAAVLAANDFATVVAQKVAHILLRRTMANTEAASDGDTVSLSSLYGLVQSLQEAAVNNTTLTVYRTDGTTVLGTKALTTDENAEPITSIS